MSAKIKVEITRMVVLAALAVFAVLEMGHLHGWVLWLAFLGYAVAVLCLGYLGKRAEDGTK